MALFGGKGRKNDNQSVVRILWIGLIVLAINMIVYLLHILDVQQQFRTVKIEEVYQQFQNVSHIFETEYMDAQRYLVQISKGMDNDRSVVDSEEQLFTMLESCNAAELYVGLYFITDDGVSYSDKGVREKVSREELKDVYQVEEPTIRIAEDEFDTDGNGILYYLQPVSIGGEKRGQLLAKVSMASMFAPEAFETLKKFGDLFLITGDGSIYLRDTELFMDDGQMYRNIYDLLSDQSADRTSKQNIDEIKVKTRMVERAGRTDYEYLKTSIINQYETRYYIEIRAVTGIRDSFLVTVYPEMVYTDVTRPLLFRTLLISCFLFMITIIVVVYMWWTSKVNDNMIRKLAYEDPVTGGKNDNYFREIASQVIWENTSVPYVVMRFDIANFRYINEAYGHVRADELLKIIDGECNSIFNQKEFCARMNSDQFLLLARNGQDLDARVEELLQRVNERAREIGIMFPIRLKRGVYPINKDDTDIGIIIDHANAARKSLTGDEKILVATYSEQIISQMFLNDKIESDMENAMKTEEFKVFIQAKWDIKNDHVHGGEALVRWIKEDGSRIFPDQFIPVFEKNGFVEKLDMYMLEQVCKYQRRLIDAGKEIYPISVNQSRLLMHNPDYLPQVERLIKKYRIPNGYVELEITETVFQDERSLMIHTTNELKKMEIQLAMDDFGSGYSSLNMLKDVPFDVIKIDREFFSESITSKASVWILRKIIEMAEGLGIKTLCEGVENEEQVRLLRDLDCYYVQGYFYSKPMPFEEYIELYCHDKENGREYYDRLYETQAEQREERRKREEKEKDRAAANAVETFKRSHVTEHHEEKSEKQDNAAT